MTKPHAVILSPILPVWDEGNFCKDLQQLFIEQGIAFDIIDTLSFVDQQDPESLLKTLEQYICSHFPQNLLLVGFALGGTIAQCLSSRIHQTKAILSISGPSYMDEPLKLNLERLVSFLEQAELNKAIDLLHEFVLPSGDKNKIIPSPSLTSDEQSLASQRLYKGFNLLLQLDSRKTVQQFIGKFLSIVGEQSQLATLHNQALTQCRNHEYKVIKHAGMRPWEENPNMINSLISDWIKQL